MIRISDEQRIALQQDLEAIRRGLTQLANDKGTPVDEVRQQLASELGFSARPE